MVAKPRALFIGGTSSHSGKSWMATAVCRYLRRRGIRVAPFKAQNMSLNSFPCRNGGEIGRAQVVQAEACELEPETDMNPILLKPSGPEGCQVVVDGKVWRNVTPRGYYEHFDELLGRVMDAWERLSRRFEYIVIEGAGSVSELNLKARDLVNFGFATRVGAPALLVADIERGGVFASVVGTFCVLDEAERRLLRSFAINRFRGDVSLFDEGVPLLENKTGRRCLGVFPMLEGVEIDAEDSVGLPSQGGSLPVAIVRFPRISNFTDFKLLDGAAWVDRPVEGQFETVILPGSKNTIADLAWMRRRGLAEWVLRQHRGGARVLGVCGGYQMLGNTVADPDGVEAGGAVAGLGLLPVDTVMLREKTTQVVRAATPGGVEFVAYEIHMGRTERPRGCEPFAHVGGAGEGVRLGAVAGTYLHGALENAAVLRETLGIDVPPPAPKDQHYEALADWFERHADTRLFEELYL